MHAGKCMTVHANHQHVVHTHACKMQVPTVANASTSDRPGSPALASSVLLERFFMSFRAWKALASSLTSSSACTSCHTAHFKQIKNIMKPRSRSHIKALLAHHTCTHRDMHGIRFCAFFVVEWFSSSVKLSACLPVSLTTIQYSKTPSY